MDIVVRNPDHLFLHFRTEALISPVSGSVYLLMTSNWVGPSLGLGLEQRAISYKLFPLPKVSLHLKTGHSEALKALSPCLNSR